ncbi:MAG TPA: RNA polymerase sigma factor [Armatimonadota bacterium]|jgi:RNA polymerase sigma-70 factor (ECF subfamily)
MLSLARGEEGALATLRERHQRWVQTLIGQFFRDPDLVEDLTQDTFLRVYQARERYRPRARFRTWLRRVVVNLCLNEQHREQTRERWRGPGLEAREVAELAETAPPLEARLLRREGGAELAAAVRALPPRQREVLLLRHGEGWSYAQIGERLGCTEAAVDSLLRRATGALRERLEPPAL